MESKHDRVCNELKKYHYKLNKNDEHKTNLLDAYIDGYIITSPYVQSVFRNVVKSVDKSIVVTFSAYYDFKPVIQMNRHEA